ncbi:multicopper oxidase family protein [Sorangium sp. So ce341]|uniref:multicopper oxidase family protein n=1 Tax=Sorangium sp. So ce341 TaxID=3133302 RepID=UPI003F5FB321
MKTSRRNFLQIVGGAIVASRSGAGCGGDEPPEDKAPTNLRYTLTIGWLSTTMDGLKVKLRSYNGSVPGPTLAFHPGDRVEITIDNRLTPYDSSAWDGDHNVPHDLNTTNLHLHGLDVIPHLFQPLGTSDPHSDMIAIAPGQTYTYLFDIPSDHPSGFYWYHPHHHGSTAVQAVSGMAGAIVVLGSIDEVPEITAARDVHLIVSDLGLFPSEDEPDVWTYEPRQNAIWNTFGKKDAPDLVRMWDASADPPGWVNQPELKGGFTTGDYATRFYCANGAPFYREDHDPEGGASPSGTPIPSGQMQIDMQPGEVVRLRILNACSDLVMPLVLEGLDLHLIALDGVPFTAPRTMKTVEPMPTDIDPVPQWDGVVDYNASATSLVLGPGNRAELLLKAPDTPGTYELVQLHHQGQQFLSADRKVIARIVVSGAPKPMSLPTTLPGQSRLQPPITQPELSQTRDIHFTGAFPGQQNPVVGIDFSLNEVQYEVHTINTTVALDAAEEWRLSAMKHADGNAEGHPFHIHVNSFEVKEINQIAQPAGTIMDTLWVGVDQSATVWMRFKQWTGKTVYHCHILPHEDTGMMANLLIEAQ